MFKRKNALYGKPSQAKSSPSRAHRVYYCVMQAKHSPMRLAEAVENLLQRESVPFSKPMPGVLELQA